MQIQIIVVHSIYAAFLVAAPNP